MKNILFLNVTNHEKQLPYYLHGAGWDFEEKDVLRPEGCQWYQINICKGGSGTLYIKGKEIVVNRGDALIIFPDEPYQYIPLEDNLQVFWCAFDGFQVNSFFKSSGVTSSGVYSFYNPEDIYSSIKSLSNLRRVNFTEQGYEGSKAVYNLLLNIKRNLRFDKNRNNDYTIDKIKPSIDFMNNNLSRQITIEEISDAIGITPQHFCLLFKSVMNQRPFEFLNSMRINYAKNLLISKPDYPINEVSILSGYPNHNYFCQKFKKQERLTPAKFRELYRKDN